MHQGADGRPQILRNLRACGLSIAVWCAIVALMAGSGCTHLLETRADSLPGRIDYPGFSFERPEGRDWYLSNAPAAFTLLEFKRHSDGVETLIRVSRIQAPAITNADQLTEFAENMPGEDPQVSVESGHGATCVRYRARSALTVNYEASAAPQYQHRMVTDEDSLDCIDPLSPGDLITFTFSQRGHDGGSADGANEADVFIRSVRFARSN